MRRAGWSEERAWRRDNRYALLGNEWTWPEVPQLARSERIAGRAQPHANIADEQETHKEDSRNAREQRDVVYYTRPADPAWITPRQLQRLHPQSLAVSSNMGYRLLRVRVQTLLLSV